jgi:TRAP-type C4-dicarboxylate transport system substrate-binding protein
LNASVIGTTGSGSKPGEIRHYYYNAKNEEDMHNTRILAAIFVSTAVALSWSTIGATATTTTVRFQTYAGTEFDEIAAKFKDYVKKESNGSLRIQYFHGGEMLASEQYVEGVSRGTIHIAYGIGSYWPGTVDISNIEAGLPGAWTSVEEARDLFENKGLGDLVAEAYDEAGVKLIGRAYGSNYDLLTKEPVTSLKDLENMKIRATGQFGKMLQKVGVSTFYLPAEELYVGLSTGVIDGLIYGGPKDYAELKLNEAAEYYTHLNVLYPGWTTTIIANPRFWEGLSAKERNVLSEGVDLYARGVHNFLEKGNKQIIEDGEIFKFNKLPDEDSARLIEAAQSLWELEAQKSERTRKAIDILRENAKSEGRLGAHD